MSKGDDMVFCNVSNISLGVANPEKIPGITTTLGNVSKGNVRDTSVRSR